MARSIRALAERARALYGGELDLLVYEIRVEEAWRELVHQAGGLYRVTAEIPLTPDTRTFTLPTDYREPIGTPQLGYATRTITSAVRTSNVVTVVTAAVHGLVAGVSVTIAGATPAGATDFSGTVTVATVTNTTTFTYQQTAADDTGTGGTVSCAALSQRLEPLIYAYQALGSVTEETAGVPSYYFFPDASTIGVYPISNGTYAALTLEYDAEAPETLSTSSALPGPGYLERGLMAYAATMAGYLDKTEGYALFADAVTTWKSAQVLRTY